MLGQCVYTKPGRIRRHDFIPDRLSSKGTIIKEPTDRGELKEPDYRDRIEKILDVPVVYKKDTQVKKDGISEILRR